jgi:hypothetical protein
MIPFPTLPRWAWALIAAAALALAFAAWLALHDRKVIRDHEAAVTADVTTRDAAGDAAGAERAEGVRERVEAGNVRASEAAEASDDPLKAGLDELHK